MTETSAGTGPAAVTVAIPTFNRGRILLETLERLRNLDEPPAAILVADQTVQHPRDVEDRLKELHLSGLIAWMRLAEPSIPRAMNLLLGAAPTPLVLFIDDDVIPDPSFVRAHVEAHRNSAVWAVAGQVLQPGQMPCHSEESDDPLAFAFNCSSAQFVGNVMAGNLSVKREHAVAVGGFDENFVGAAYRFETDFALRLIRAGGKIWFEPTATLRHLQLSTGGLRSFGDHRSAAVPDHSVGDYYFARLHAPSVVRHAIERLRSNILTRHLALHPWHVPPKVIGEVRGFFLARNLYRKGRRLRSVLPGKPS